MLVMETESGKEEVPSLTKGIPDKEEEVLKESLESEAKVDELPEEEEERLLAEEEEEEAVPDEVLESCVVREEISEEASATLGLIESELVEKEEVEEDLEEAKEEEIVKEPESMLVEVVAGHCIEGGEVVEEVAEIDDVSSKGDSKQGPAKFGVKDQQEIGSEGSGGDSENVGKVQDAVKAGSPPKAAGQLGAKETSVEMPEKKKNSLSKEVLSHPKIKKEPKEPEESPKTPVSGSGEENIACERAREEASAKVKVEPHEDVEGASKAAGKGDGDSSNQASDEYEEEGQEDVAEETPEEESHGEKRSCVDDSAGGSSEESGGICCKRKRLDGGEEGSSHHSAKDALLLSSEKEGGVLDESLDHKVERLKKEIHMLGVMAKQKEAEWDEIIRAKKVKEESLLRLQRRRRIVAIGREVALAERRRHRREGRRARTEADVTSEDEGTDEEWYMQIRGMTGGTLPGSRIGTAGPRTATGRAPLRNTPSTSSSFMLGMNASPFPHSTLAPSSTSTVPSIVSSTFTQRMHRPILPKPPLIPNTPVSRRNVVQNSNQTVTTSMANPLIPATVPTNGGLGGNSCNPMDNSQNANQVIGEGRQGPILDVRSIIADYRSRHPETVPLRGRRNKSLTPTPAAAMMSREGVPGSGGGGSDGGPSDVPATPEGTVNNSQGILNIASLALGSGSQVRTRGVQPQESSSSDIGYLLLSSGNGCGQGGSLPIRQQPPTRDSSRPSSTESSRSGGQAVPPVSLSSAGLVDGSGNFSFKDVLVQFARMSQSEQQQQMMAVIPGMSNQGLLSTAPTLQSQLSAPGRQPRHILPSTTTSSTALPGPMATPTRPPPPPYPEVTLLPVLVAGNEGSAMRPNIPTEIPMPRTSIPVSTPSLLQMSLSAPTTSPQVPSPPSTSLLHGILTKSGTGVGSSSMGSTPGGATPRATAFAPTLARLLTAPEKQPSLGPVRATPPATTGSSVLGSQAFVSIGELLSTSKAKNEITITPVSGAPGQSSLLKQPQQAVSRSIKEEATAHMEEEQDDSTDRLVIDESAAASEAEARRQAASRQPPQPLPAMAQETVEESMADEEVEEEEVAMEEEEGMEEEGAMEDEEEEGEEGPVPECQGCHSRAAQFVCAGCGNQWYCSRDCQVSAWDEHSEVCSG
ncbi:hypothetical protein J437_LFUL010357 [Ladona fulva]|uniref:MYND-type domain-containing protein n=1 Tax=Ladona fulva TaxID=123851 RepID=A0A8K0P104_LADFU|nr:hypothetical protein J437_LFUL010357 [Ladona fulva]